MEEKGAFIKQNVSTVVFKAEKSKQLFGYDSKMYYLCSRKQTKRK